jgi:integrase
LRAAILDAVEDELFKNFLTAMKESGCRPSEISQQTAENVLLEQGIWVLQKHKNAKKGMWRVIYLSPVLLELSKKLVEQRSTGPFVCE